MSVPLHFASNEVTLQEPELNLADPKQINKYTKNFTEPELGLDDASQVDNFKLTIVTAIS